MNQSFTVIYFTITRRESLEEVYDDKIYGPESVLFKAGSKMQVLRGRVLTISVYPPQLEGLVMSPAYIAASLMRALCKVIRPTKYLMYWIFLSSSGGQRHNFRLDSTRDSGSDPLLSIGCVI